MDTTLHRETAKIYQFPAGGRIAYNANRRTAQASEALSSARLAKVVYGGSMYHEAAIEDADPARKR
jgi:hypothetical protein